MLDSKQEKNAPVANTDNRNEESSADPGAKA
jgi:hypothetical protein